MEKTKKNGKRVRIGDDKKAQNKKKTYQVDWTVWDILRPSIIRMNRAEYEMDVNLPYKSHRERIKDYSTKLHKADIVDAFKSVYEGMGDISLATRAVANTIPEELRVGSVIKLHITGIDKKKGVTFDSGCYKNNFITRSNLAAYEKLLESPNQYVSVRVIEIKPDYTVVDVFGPMVEEFIVPRSTNPWIQNTLENIKTVTVKNLHLVRGGFMGKAIIPNVTDFCGRDYEVDAFIPGSQICLNATSDFESYEGQTVETFIMSYGPRPGGGMSLVCSVKQYLRHLGNIELKGLHNLWCEHEQAWDNFSTTPLAGVVTGVINSQKKCGVFVELPEYKITGMIPMKPEDLTSYTIGQELTVNFTDFDEDLTYNDAVGQYQHKPAFEMVDGAIKSVSVKPILKLV